MNSKLPLPKRATTGNTHKATINEDILDYSIACHKQDT